MNIAVIGSGPGGYVAALKAAQLGAKVTVIEDNELGGTCLNWGCIPTKALTASTEMLNKVRNLGDFGIDLEGDIKVDLAKIMDRKDRVVSTMIKGIGSLFKSWSIELLRGRGRLVSEREVLVTKSDGSTTTVKADRIILATGSRPAEIAIFPFDGNRILSSTDALSLREIPKSIIIIGAGVIGCEFACIFRELGTEVTIVEVMQRAVSTEDEDISEILQKEFKKKKIKLLLSVRAVRSEVSDKEVRVYLEDGSELVAERLLVSIGRAFNVEDLGLEGVGIERGSRGEIKVNSRMRTNIEGIYAVGDVTGGILLAHVASKEGIVAAYNACGIDREIDYTVVPSAIFTSPEIGSVGLREHQCKERGIPYRVGRFQFRGLGKAHAIGEINGMVKIIADAETDKILGVHIVGPHASDLIHEGALALYKGMTAKELGDMIHAHPTLSEAVMEASHDLHGEAIHSPKRN